MVKAKNAKAVVEAFPVKAIKDTSFRWPEDGRLDSLTLFMGFGDKEHSAAAVCFEQQELAGSRDATRQNVLQRQRKRRNARDCKVFELSMYYEVPSLADSTAQAMARTLSRCNVRERLRTVRRHAALENTSACGHWELLVAALEANSVLWRSAIEELANA